MIQQPFTFPYRELIDPVEVKGVRLIKICTLPVEVAGLIQQIRFEKLLRSSDRVRKILRERVVRLEIQALRESAPHFELQRVVVIRACVREQLDLPDVRV